MNANVTTGIRELTAQELDQVTGGRGAEMDGAEIFMSHFIGTLFIAGVVGALWNLIFG
jgi:hypothetical protein